MQSSCLCVNLRTGIRFLHSIYIFEYGEESLKWKQLKPKPKQTPNNPDQANKHPTPPNRQQK